MLKGSMMIDHGAFKIVFLASLDFVLNVSAFETSNHSL